MIVLEETPRAKKLAANTTTGDNALHVTYDHSSGNHGGNRKNNNRNSTNHSGRGGGSNIRNEKGKKGNDGGRGSQPPTGTGSSSGMGGGQNYGQLGQRPNFNFNNWAGPQGYVPWQYWPSPPCPYPTAGPTQFYNKPRILGPRPPQAHVAAVQSAQSTYSPTDIQQAMHTLSISPPDDQWYMDTGVTSHMTANGDGEAFNEV